jgi:hypothetical protein
MQSLFLFYIFLFVLVLSLSLFPPSFLFIFPVQASFF